MTRGLRNRGFKSWLAGGWNEFKENFVRKLRTRTIYSADNDFKELGKTYNDLYVDINKKLIRIDQGEWKSPEQLNNEKIMSNSKLIAVRMAMRFAEMHGWNNIIIGLPKENRPSMISINGGGFVDLVKQALTSNDKKTDVKQIAVIEHEVKKIQETHQHLLR